MQVMWLGQQAMPVGSKRLGDRGLREKTIDVHAAVHLSPRLLQFGQRSPRQRG